MISKIRIVLLCVLLSGLYYAQIPILNSYPAVTNKVIYLDFDGQVVSGTFWNSGNTVNALPSTMSPANIIQIFKRMSEDYRPFDVNITTDSVRFNNASPTTRMRIVVTPTSAWYGSAGGVAYVGSFTWGGTPGTPCWVFENMLSYSAKNIAEAASHEAGHTLTLRHQSTYSSSTCSKTAEYNPGQGTGVISWAPIMGVGYYTNVTTWYNGLSATSCTLIQNDHSNSGIGITSPGYLNFWPDDVGNTAATAKILNLNTLTLLDSGLIATPGDIDAFRFTLCNNRYVTIDIKPWALDTNVGSYQGANLDVKLFLYNSSNTQLAVDSQLTRLNSRIGMNLGPGTYWFTVDGGGSPNYSDYGSLGRYFVNIKATNPPGLNNIIIANSNYCAGQPFALNYTSNGLPTQWQWTVDGTNYSQQYPTVTLNAGTHTVSLLASNSALSSCPTTATLYVQPLPPVAVSSSTNYVCYGDSATLYASGATTYTWLPANVFAGSAATQSVTPQVTSTYTVMGSNGGCSNSTLTTITVNPDFTVTAMVSAANICLGSPVTLTGGGASNYSIEPGGISTSSAVVFPNAATDYTITGESGGCSKVASVSVSLRPHFNFSVSPSDSVLCLGAGAFSTLTAVGANNYTVSPGAFSGSVVPVSPAATTVYTITAQIVNNACLEDTTILVALRDCNVAGIRQQTKISEGIRIYPNPAHGQLIIETTAGNQKIEVFNAVGQLISVHTMSSKALQLGTETWPAGVYFVKIVSADAFYTERVIVE